MSKKAASPGLCSVLSQTTDEIWRWLRGLANLRKLYGKQENKRTRDIQSLGWLLFWDIWNIMLKLVYFWTLWAFQPWSRLILQHGKRSEQGMDYSSDFSVYKWPCTHFKHLLLLLLSLLFCCCYYSEEMRYSGVILHMHFVSSIQLSPHGIKIL